MSGKLTKQQEQKLLKKFLKEQNLTTSFNRFKRIKRKRNITVILDGESKDVVVYRKNNRTIIADARTFKPISSTKKYNTKNINKAFQPKEVQFKKRGIIVSKLTRPLRFGEISRRKLKNVDLITRATPTKKLMGRLILNLTLTKGKRKVTRTGYSASLKDLSHKPSKELAYNEAFQNAIVQLPFSYETYRINWVHYDYFVRRK